DDLPAAVSHREPRRNSPRLRESRHHIGLQHPSGAVKHSRPAPKTGVPAGPKIGTDRPGLECDAVDFVLVYGRPGVDPNKVIDPKLGLALDFRERERLRKLPPAPKTLHSEFIPKAHVGPGVLRVTV